MLREYCELYDKKLEDLTEQEEQCRIRRDWSCTTCECYAIKEYDESGVVLNTIRPEQSIQKGEIKTCKMR